MDWTNASFTPIYTERPLGLYSLRREALWFDDKRNIIYSFGGSNLDMEYKRLLDSIQGFTPNGKGGGDWKELLGAVGNKPFPSDIHGTTAGMFAGDAIDGCYLGGFISSYTSPLAPNQRYNNTGLLRFNFESLTMTNSSGPESPIDHGVLLNVPIYGSSGVLLAFGGTNDQYIVGFNNIKRV